MVDIEPNESLNSDVCLEMSSVASLLMLQRFKAILLESLADLSVSLAPAILAEMVTSAVDKLKLCIAKQLLFCRGNCLVHHIFSKILMKQIIKPVTSR